MLKNCFKSSRRSVFIENPNQASKSQICRQSVCQSSHLKTRPWKSWFYFPQRFSGKSFSFLLNASDVNDDDNDDHDNDDVDDDDHDDVDVVKQLNKKWTLFEWKAVIGRGIVSGSFFCQNFFQTSRFRIERVRKNEKGREREYEKRGWM